MLGYRPMYETYRYAWRSVTVTTLSDYKVLLSTSLFRVIDTTSTVLGCTPRCRDVHVRLALIVSTCMWCSWAQLIENGPPGPIFTSEMGPSAQSRWGSNSDVTRAPARWNWGGRSVLINQLSTLRKCIMILIISLYEFPSKHSFHRQHYSRLCFTIIHLQQNFNREARSTQRTFHRRVDTVDVQIFVDTTFCWLHSRWIYIIILWRRETQKYKTIYNKYYVLFNNYGKTDEN